VFDTVSSLCLLEAIGSSFSLVPSPNGYSTFEIQSMIDTIVGVCSREYSSR